MKADQYFDLKAAIIEAGYAHEIDWIAEIKPCDDPITFRNEAIWVILNSGMKEQIARIIHKRIWEAYTSKRDISTAFRHEGKVKAIKFIMDKYPILFKGFYESVDKLSYLQTIPFIGGITKYHLAKNLGMDVVKPDRHLVRIAKQYNFDDCFKMCQYLRSETGDKLSLIDMVIWRAANLGLV